MSFARLEDGAVVEYPVDVRQRHRNVSFPTTWLGGVVDGLTYAYVYPSDVPAATHETVAVQSTPTLVEGRYIERWELVEVDAEVASQRLAERWRGVREERNGLLSASDWTQVLDAPLSAEAVSAWRVYRQALRDLTKQATPYKLTWPEAP